MLIMAEISGWWLLGIAIGGGIAGAVGTAAIYLTRRFFAARREVLANNWEVLDRDEDLLSWVADRSGLLVLQLRRITERHNVHEDGSTSFTSSAHDYDLVRAKETALHEYRDQERQLFRDVRRIAESEDWRHDYWRSHGLQELPTPTAPQRVQKMLDLWRTDVTKSGTGVVTPSDPTRESFEQAYQRLKDADFGFGPGGNPNA